ncbi:hypothetical protein A3860_09060 [Niastella vici]|uniref:AprE-like beta-barrel domain-containing protein n=1 Tax=Niastella vici TaxID=1703345 RepID=A0A1V9FHC5_9BACT|nr:HlyD family efflux transporter periplasmic adaptor subunit [Niastella vici]OQP57765.1 hypothetical protein A3860_09060 [Niastella vici]
MDKKDINGASKETTFAESIKETISQRSEIVQDVLDRKPKFIERWAFPLFLIILIALSGASWFVQYPDIIETRATITAANAPKEIMPYQEGRIVKLFIKNKDIVKKGDLLAWIESTANHGEVLKLSTLLDSCIELISTGQNAAVSELFNTNFNNLGELQQEYRGFVSSLQLFNDYIANGFYTKKKRNIENDIQSLEGTRQTIQNQKNLTEQQLKLVEESYNMNNTLFKDRIISAEELRTQKANLLNKQMDVSKIDASLFSNEVQKREKRKEIEQIDHDISQQENIFQQALLLLKSSVDQWIKRYVLQSPIDGEVSLVIQLQENQFIQQGRLIGFINPRDSRFYAETYLPQQNFGKIATGAKVQLRVDAYPYQETGILNGKLDYISNVASDSGFLATIQFERGLTTNNKFTIPYKNGLRAQAIIITKDMRLLQRLYYGLIKSTSIGKK